MSEWLQIKSLEMLVSKAEYSIETNTKLNLLFFSCDLLNIARGRCDIFLKKNKLPHLKNFIEINSEKPIMLAEVNLNDSKFDDILIIVNNYIQNKSKKIKVILDLNTSLAVRNDGILSIENNIKVDINNIKLVLPLI